MKQKKMLKMLMLTQRGHALGERYFASVWALEELGNDYGWRVRPWISEDVWIDGVEPTLLRGLSRPSHLTSPARPPAAYVSGSSGALLHADSTAALLVVQSFSHSFGWKGTVTVKIHDCLASPAGRALIKECGEEARGANNGSHDLWLKLLL